MIFRKRLSGDNVSSTGIVSRSDTCGAANTIGNSLYQRAAHCGGQRIGPLRRPGLINLRYFYIVIVWIKNDKSPGSMVIPINLARHAPRFEIMSSQGKIPYLQTTVFPGSRGQRVGMRQMYLLLPHGIPSARKIEPGRPRNFRKPQNTGIKIT